MRGSKTCLLWWIYNTHYTVGKNYHYHPTTLTKNFKGVCFEVIHQQWGRRASSLNNSNQLSAEGFQKNINKVEINKEKESICKLVPNKFSNILHQESLSDEKSNEVNSKTSKNSTLSSDSSVLASIHNYSLGNGRGDFYYFFQLPVDIDLSIAQLQKKYHEIQHQVHPDAQNSMTSDTSAENNSSASSSSLPTPDTSVITSEDSIYANLGYNLLRDPYLRVKYTLALIKRRIHNASKDLSWTLRDGEEVFTQLQEESSSINHNISKDFLTVLLDLNELVSDLENLDQRESKSIEEAYNNISNVYNLYWERVKQYFYSEDWEALERCVLEWVYVNRLKQRILEIKDITN